MSSSTSSGPGPGTAYGTGTGTGAAPATVEREPPRDVFLVDVDVHPTMMPASLEERLSGRALRHWAEFGPRVAGAYAMFPRMRNGGFRVDARPEHGRPGSDLGLVQRQHLDEYEMGTDRVNGGSRRELLVIDDFAPNHNGGNIVFGPDGFLYWGMGDGGGAGDPAGTGQNPGDLLGDLLRIDPDVAPEERDNGATYSIPDGNPFRNGGGAPEVWAFGLRNPWRFSFDRATGDLWIADVGQGDIEEIDFLPATGGTGAGRGANFGWSSVEGNNPFNEGTAPEGAVGPIFAYDHDGGRCSITGGYVYRGEAIPALVGIYLYADFCGGEIRGLAQENGEAVSEGSLDQVVSFPSSFGEDNDGELYVLSLSGPVYRIAAAG